MDYINCLVVVFGEIKYRCFNIKEKKYEKRTFSRNWKESVDIDMDKLFMEHTDDEFIPTRTLAMRGSWRLAQNQVMGTKTFDQLQTEEYCKKL